MSILNLQISDYQPGVFLHDFDRVLSFARFGSLAFSLAYLTGCATDRAMMPTPSIYEGDYAKTLFATLPDNQKQPGIELLFATDRALNTDPEISLPYGADRSRETAFGTLRVEMGPDLTWDDLVLQSQLSERTKPVNLTLAAVTEIGRFPATPYPIQITPEGLVYHLRLSQNTNA